MPLTKKVSQVQNDCHGTTLFQFTQVQRVVSNARVVHVALLRAFHLGIICKVLGRLLWCSLQSFNTTY